MRSELGSLGSVVQCPPRHRYQSETPTVSLVTRVMTTSCDRDMLTLLTMVTLVTSPVTGASDVRGLLCPGLHRSSAGH